MNNIELADKIANMWCQSRHNAGKSQAYVAKALGVSTKTIQNWEDGTSTPSFRNAIEWFNALDEPIYPYLLALFHPEEFEGLSPNSELFDIKKALHVAIDELPEAKIRQLMFLLNGNHGTSPMGVMESLTAYLHIPMYARVGLTEAILTNYEITEALGLIENNEHIKPNTQTIREYVNTAKEAVLNGKGTYVFPTMKGDNKGGEVCT